MEKVEKLTQSQIIDLGWTKKLINDFLPEPELKTNPYYSRKGSPMKLWKKEEVKRISETKEFQEAFEKAKKRKKGAAKAVDTKVRKLLDDVDEKIEKIKVDIVPIEKLVEDTLKNKEEWYNMQRSFDYDGYEITAYNADEATIARWVVNYIRHNLTDYDEDLYNIAGKVGVGRHMRNIKMLF